MRPTLRRQPALGKIARRTAEFVRTCKARLACPSADAETPEHGELVGCRVATTRGRLADVFAKRPPMWILLVRDERVQTSTRAAATLPASLLLRSGLR